ncbi:TPA: hypothetical protein R1937_000285 [Staphylococcus delphini]|nr:hypothetical protein [Staphylococcus delphini]
MATFQFKREVNIFYTIPRESRPSGNHARTEAKNEGNSAFGKANPLKQSYASGMFLLESEQTQL